MERQERLQLRKDDLQEHWNLLRQKLSVLERERILETRAEESLRLKGKIEDVREQLRSIEEDLGLVEMELEGAPSVPSTHPPGQTVPPVLPYEPELIEIPAGSFLMGSHPGEGYPANESPQHSVQLSSFLISRTPITNAQYESFVRQSGYDAPKGWLLRKPSPDKNDHPVTQVSWHDAAAYCAWLQEQSGSTYRLPTEAEWEKAARWTDARLYPWGNEWQGYCCNCGSESTAPVNAFPQGASAYGCLDMLGNVREWTSTIWGTGPMQADFSYPFQQDGRNASIPGAGSVFRIHRGGSFRDNPINLRCSARGFSPESSKVAWCGFRVVMVKE